jgi:hypothetical protein
VAADLLTRVQVKNKIHLILTIHAGEVAFEIIQNDTQPATHRLQVRQQRKT